MNTTFKYALAAILGASLVVPAAAQNFPDIPDNHWAFEALENLRRDGILVGYPDGFFRGNRPLSRYELAIALNAAYQRLMGISNGLEDRIAALEEAIEGRDTAEIQALRDQLNELRQQVDGMRQWGDEIAALRRLAEEFERELAAQGVDVQAMRRDLADLEDRVTAIEGRLPDVKITGDANLLVLAGHSTDGRFGLTQDGRLLGVGRDSYAGAPVGVTRDLTVLHEAAFRFEGTKEDGPQWHATLVAGNLLPTAGGYNFLPGSVGGAPFGEGNTDVYFYDFVVKFDTSLLGQGFSASVGRQGYQVGRYLWQRQNFTPWFHNERWDNGDWIMDGGVVTFGFGSGSLELFGGRNSDRNSVNGVDLNAIPFGTGTVDSTLGAVLGFNLGDNGSLKLAYIIHDSNTQIGGLGNANRLSVYGAELGFDFGPLTFTGAYSESVVQENNSNRLSSDNAAWDLGLAYNTDNFMIGGGYRRVEGNFLAAGDWGRIGTFWNPTNVEGFNVHAGINFGGGRLTGKFEQLDGITAGLGLLGGSDSVRSLMFGFDYQINPTWGLELSYEQADFDFNVGNDARQTWFGVGLTYSLSDASFLRLGYLYSDVDNNGRFTGFPGLTGRYTGGLISTQLSIKF